MVQDTTRATERVREISRAFSEVRSEVAKVIVGQQI